jgi:L-fuculose-phosphate aldolase
MPKLGDLKEKIAQAMRILDYLDVWEANYGHVSSRIPGDKNKICILGHLHDHSGEGAPLSDVGPEHMIVVDIETLEHDGRFDPPAEIYIHTEIYRAREDVNSVVHGHPEWPVALSIADQPILPVHYYSGLFHPSIPIFDEHRLIDSRESGSAMVKALGDHVAVVLRGHGAATVGASIEESVVVMSLLNVCARLQYLAAQVGTPRPIKVAKDASRHLSEHYLGNKWSLYRNLAEAARTGKIGSDTTHE